MTSGHGTAPASTGADVPVAEQRRLYHRMAAGPQARWWLPILATVALVAIAFVFQVVVSLGGLAADGRLDTTFLDQLVAFASIAAILPAIFVAARVWRRGGGELSSVAGRIRWKWLLLCAAVALPAFPLHLLVVVALSVVAEPALLEAAPTDPAAPSVVATGAIVTIALLLVLVPLQAAAEEYLTRGWIVQVVGAYLRTPWIGVGIGAVVFVLLHGESTLAGYGSLLTFALVLGWLVVRTGGLEAGIAFHALWNVPPAVLMVLAGEPDTGSNLGDSGWPVLVGQLIVMPLYAFVVARLATPERLGS